MSLNELGQQFLATTIEKGFTTGKEGPLYVTEKLMLTVSELAEALEELRKGIPVTTIYYNADKPTKPEGFPIEIADAIIRLLQMTAGLEIDIDAAVALKDEYNKSRPYKHGKAF